MGAIDELSVTKTSRETERLVERYGKIFRKDIQKKKKKTNHNKGRRNSGVFPERQRKKSKVITQE